MFGYDNNNTILGKLNIYRKLPNNPLIVTSFLHQGLQSTHGLTELISYIIRLIINCLALLCVIPTALRWRREQEVLKQLQGLASRLQLATPPPSTPKQNGGSLTRQSSRSGSKRRRRHSGVDNPAFIIHESQVPFPYSYGVFGSQNEFNASIFGLDPSQYIGQYPPTNFNRKSHTIYLNFLIIFFFKPYYVYFDLNFSESNTLSIRLEKCNANENNGN